MLKKGRVCLASVEGLEEEDEDDEEEAPQSKVRSELFVERVRLWM